MTSVDLKNIKGEVVGSFDLDDRVFGVEPNRAVVHQAVVAQLANQRKGTASTKTRGEVRGGTHKMWRQKGTGRARQGDRRAPHWKGGGVVFGPHPRSYHQDLPRKMRRIAMKSALSARVAESALTVVDELALAAPKTREVRGVLEALGLNRGALIVVAERDEAVTRASRNLPDVRAVTPGGLNLLDVMKFHHLVFTRPAVEALTEHLLATINRGRPVASSDGDAEKQESVQHGGARPMEHDAVARANAGESPDLALADAAEDVARPDASLEVSDTVPTAEADTGSARSASNDAPAASAADADEDKKEDA
jgi:large subunit ribosomal protein L4